jgi:hypothetical protein
MLNSRSYLSSLVSQDLYTIVSHRSQAGRKESGSQSSELFEGSLLDQKRRFVKQRSCLMSCVYRYSFVCQGLSGALLHR